MISKTLAIVALLASAAAHAGAGPYTPEAVAVAHQLAAEAHGGVGRVENTHSMEPTLTHKDIVVWSTVAEPKVGDIVVFKASGAIICHRIVSETDGAEWMLTKGDNNPVTDRAVSRGQLIGVVVSVVDGRTGEVRAPK